MKRNKAEELVMLSPIEELTAELDSSDQPLLSSRLAELSNLNPEELEIGGEPLSF